MKGSSTAASRVPYSIDFIMAPLARRAASSRKLSEKSRPRKSTFHRMAFNGWSASAKMPFALSSKAKSKRCQKKIGGGGGDCTESAKLLSGGITPGSAASAAATTAVTVSPSARVVDFRNFNGFHSELPGLLTVMVEPTTSERTRKRGKHLL
jgi:hypothetical protein